MFLPAVFAVHSCLSFASFHLIVSRVFSLNSLAQAVHGFDNSGRLYDELGHNVQWWTAADESRCNQRADCLAAFYSVRSLFPFVLACVLHLVLTVLRRRFRSLAAM